MILNSLFLQNHVDAETASNLKNGKQKSTNYLFADIIKLVAAEQESVQAGEQNVAAETPFAPQSLSANLKPNAEPEEDASILKSFEAKLSVIVDRILKQNLPKSSSVFSQKELKTEIREMLSKDFAPSENTPSPENLDAIENQIESVLRSIFNLSENSNIVIVDDTPENSNIIHVEKLSNESTNGGKTISSESGNSNKYILKVYDYEKLADAEVGLYQDSDNWVKEVEDGTLGFNRSDSVKSYLHEKFKSEPTTSRIKKVLIENELNLEELNSELKTPLSERTIDPIPKEVNDKLKAENKASDERQLSSSSSDQSANSLNINIAQNPQDNYSEIQKKVERTFLQENSIEENISTNGKTSQRGKALKFADIYSINTPTDEIKAMKKIAVMTENVKNGERHSQKPEADFVRVLKTSSDEPHKVKIFAYKKLDSEVPTKENPISIAKTVFFRLDDGKAIVKILGDLPKDQHARIEQILSAREDFLKPIRPESAEKPNFSTPTGATRFFEADLSEKLNSAYLTERNNGNTIRNDNGESPVNQMLKRAGTHLDRIDSMLKNLSIDSGTHNPDARVLGNLNNSQNISEFYNKEYWGIGGKKSSNLYKMNFMKYKAFQNSYQSINKVSDISKGLKYVAGELDASFQVNGKSQKMSQVQVNIQELSKRKLKTEFTDPKLKLEKEVKGDGIQAKTKSSNLVADQPSTDKSAVKISSEKDNNASIEKNAINKTDIAEKNVKHQPQVLQSTNEKVNEDNKPQFSGKQKRAFVNDQPVKSNLLADDKSDKNGMETTHGNKEVETKTGQKLSSDQTNSGEKGDGNSGAKHTGHDFKNSDRSGKSIHSGFQSDLRAADSTDVKSRMQDLFSEQKPVRVDKLMDEVQNFIHKSDKQTVTLILDPKELGTVKLSIDMSDKIVHARFEVENEAVKKAIESQFNQLNNNLQSSGLQVGSFNVALSGSDHKNLKNYESKKKDRNENADEVKTAEKDDDADAKSKMVGYNTYDYIA